MPGTQWRKGRRVKARRGGSARRPSNDFAQDDRKQSTDCVSQVAAAAAFNELSFQLGLLVFLVKACPIGLFRWLAKIRTFHCCLFFALAFYCPSHHETRFFFFFRFFTVPTRLTFQTRRAFLRLLTADRFCLLAR